MQIRLRTANDDAALLAVFRSAVRGVASRDYTPEQIAAWAPDEMDFDAWRRRRAAKPTFVAEAEGDVVGFSDLEPDGHIDMLFVHADWQGRGVATALLQAVETAAADQGLERLFTEASLTARPFFARRGFSLIAQQTVTIRGAELTNFRMQKRLNA